MVPKYSIIIPVYNNVSTISRCIKSIINQTYNNWECIIIDDGSTDATFNICKKFTTLDKRIKILKINHSGVGIARNIGISQAKGKYICFCDSDDTYTNNKLSVCDNVLSKNPNIKILWHALKVIQRGKKDKYWHNKITGTYNCSDPNDKILSNMDYDIGHCHNKIYERNFLIENNITFPEQCKFAEDLLFNIHAYIKAGSITNISDVLYNYYLDRSRHKIIDDVKLNFIHACDNLFNKLSSNKNFILHKNKIKKFCHNGITRHEKNVVDYVFTYVTMNDPQWLEEYNKYCSNDKKKDINDIERYKSYEEMLRIKLRGCENAMKFLHGTVHMIVSNISQVPQWINRKKIHIVCHKDIIPQELLPTFNSNTIELFMHNIFGLSEHYIYSCDDTFLVRPLTYQMLFNSNGTVNMGFKWSLHNNEMYQYSWKNASTLACMNTKYINKTSKPDTFLAPQHCHTPLIRSICEKLYDENKIALLNSCSRFREKKNIAHCFYTYWMKFHNKVNKPHYEYITTNVIQINDNFIRDLKTRNKIYSICVNDDNNATIEDYKRLIDIIYDMFPFLQKKCKYEL